MDVVDSGLLSSLPSGASGPAFKKLRKSMVFDASNKIFDWIQLYFDRSQKGSVAWTWVNQVGDFVPPVYFQHQGHSTTIVGESETCELSCHDFYRMAS